MASRVEVMLKATAHVEKTIAALAVNCHAAVTEATPVDTNWARANWIPGIGAPVLEVDGSPDAVSNARAQAGLDAVLSYKLADGSIFLSNHVPYIERLDAGSSDQAPSGFVRQAIAEAIVESGNGRLL